MMDSTNSKDADGLIDLESGRKDATNEQVVGWNIASSREQETRVFNQESTGIMGIDGVVKDDESLRLENTVSDSAELSPSRGEDFGLMDKGEGDENAGLLQNKASAKKKGSKKPSKPPRPPKSPSMDLDDQKLMRELAELAAVKRARIERMKKRMKNARFSSSNTNNNLFALIVTIVFCLVIIWQGVFSHDSSAIGFHGSPETSVQTRDALISVQFYKNFSQLAPDLSQSDSPNNVVPIPSF